MRCRRHRRGRCRRRRLFGPLLVLLLLVRYARQFFKQSNVRCGRFSRRRCCFGAKALVVIVVGAGRVILIAAKIRQISGIVLVPFVGRLLRIVADGLAIKRKHCVVETFGHFPVSGAGGAATATPATIIFCLVQSSRSVALVPFPPCRILS